MASRGKAQTEDVPSLSVGEAFARTKSRPDGLSSGEALARTPKKRVDSGERPAILAFLSQFKSPMLVLLVFAATVSMTLGDVTDGATILTIILASSILSFFQERQAGSAVKELLKSIETKHEVLRDGASVRLPVEAIVEGDVVVLGAGSSIPADGLVLSSDAMLADESALTGESVPVEKGDGAPVFAGTHVQSGSGRMLVVAIGEATRIGAVAQHLRTARPEPQFHQGVRRYGYLLMEFTLVLTLAVFAVNVWLKKPVVDSFLFSIALAVGLTPQLLPAIMSVTLARGARQMADSKVIVKRLEAIEDFGSMNVLCSDKTGTLTQGMMTLSQAIGPSGAEDGDVLLMARLNALGSKGFENPIDAALLDGAPPDFGAAHPTLASLPYDFFRKRQSTLVDWNSPTVRLICKGAVVNVLDACDGSVDRSLIETRFQELSDAGLRVLAVAYRDFETVPEIDQTIEQGLVFAGLIAFEDPLRQDSVQTVRNLLDMGVGLKLITGDNRHVAAHIGNKVGLRTDPVVTGDAIARLTGPALQRLVKTADVFAEVDPVQKERIILALRKARFVVGYIGDGINDGPALHAADVGISVSSGVDVAKEAADFVMLEHGLAVICAGVVEGRKIFANTLKYVFITTSANFGNMFSMAAASLWLPFLPLLPKQILLNNFLTDIPAMSIAGDDVDRELTERPRRWDIAAVRKFMLVFGLHSSVFDLLTFAAMILWLRTAEHEFQTGWFVESAISELLILLVIRTRGAFFKSLPGKPLLAASCVCALIVAALPYSPLAPDLGLVKLPPALLGALGPILFVYASTAELLKRWAFGSAYPL